VTFANFCLKGTGLSATAKLTAYDLVERQCYQREEGWRCPWVLALTEGDWVSEGLTCVCGMVWVAGQCSWRSA
jgi:hypothetical protein